MEQNPAIQVNEHAPEGMDELVLSPESHVYVAQLAAAEGPNRANMRMHVPEGYALQAVAA